MIVLADNDPKSLITISAILYSEGLDVIPAESGELALASISARPPKLVLLNTRLGSLNGFDVCRRLKACDDTRDIPVVFLVDSSDIDQKVQCLKSGAVDFISMPVQREELVTRVRTHLEFRRLRLDLPIAEPPVELRSAKALLEAESAKRHRSETVLRERGCGLFEIMNHAPVDVWVMDADRRLLFHNRNRVECGMPAMLLAGSADAIHPDDLRRVEREYALALRERRAFQIECRLCGANGSIRWVLHTGIPQIVGGTFAGHIGTTVDITDQKRRHERMIAADKRQSLGYLAAGIAHNFNNLVGGIFAASDLALSDLPDDSPARASMEQVMTMANRASQIVNLLQCYAADPGGRTDRINLSLVTAEMIELLRCAVPPKIVVNANLAPELPVLHADVTQLRQVIVNLLMNAFESLASGAGFVNVATDKVRIDRRNSECELRAGEYCRLVVQDNGQGMTPEVHANALVPFYSTKSVGRGLGLAVVQGIVGSLAGAIQINSSPGIGTTIAILLPVQRRLQADVRHAHRAA